MILFKSKTIKESQEFFGVYGCHGFHYGGAACRKCRRKAKPPRYKPCLPIMPRTGSPFENLATELRNDFAENKLISVNSKEESEAKQLAVNSLEDPNNEYRAVFAVDKLNEVGTCSTCLTLCACMTPGQQGRKIGKTTMSEAQLIGRGARYCPFRLSPEQPLDQRKYDQDLGHEMRVCEELVYHSAYNPKYIQELNTALQEIGIKPKETRQRDVKLKASFKGTPLYKAGYLFLNSQKKYDRSDIKGLDSSLIQKTHAVLLHTGHSQSSAVFVDKRH